MSRRRILLVSPIGNFRGWTALKKLEAWAHAGGVSIPHASRMDRLIFLYSTLKGGLGSGQRAFLLVTQERRGLAHHKSYYKSQLARWNFPRKGGKKKIVMAEPSPGTLSGYASSTVASVGLPPINTVSMPDTIPGPSHTITGVMVNGHYFPSQAHYAAAQHAQTLSEAEELLWHAPENV